MTVKVAVSRCPSTAVAGAVAATTVRFGRGAGSISIGTLRIKLFDAPSTDSSIEFVESTVTTMRCVPSTELGIVHWTVRTTSAPAAMVCDAVGAAMVRSAPIVASSESVMRSPRKPAAPPLPMLRTV